MSVTYLKNTWIASRREAAAYEIIGWDEPFIEIKYTVPEMERWNEKSFNH
jgi:hypothetical protein